MRVCALALALLAGCAPTILRVDSVPDGVDVHEATLGYLGETPLSYEVTDAQLERLENGEANLELSARGYVTWGGRVGLVEGEEITIRRTLDPVRELVTLTTDPVGAHVFALVIDSAAVGAERARTMDPLTAPQNLVVRRYLGATPVELRADGDDHLDHNTPLLFELAGYEATKTLFKANEPRVHVVLRPTNPGQR